VIHDRYRQRLFAYTRQMLTHRQDAEDALQDIFVRAYAGLRASDRELALRAWLYRVAHNRCIDELRRPGPPPPEVMQLLRSPVPDPITQADQRESLRRLIADVRRLPDQQRSALLMRELGGMSYADLAAALGVTVPAVKSLLVRARLALAQALEARDTACSDIREELIVSHDRGLRPNATARRHMRDCAGCREFRHQLRGVSRRFAAIVPTLGPLGVLANVLGVGGAGGGAAGGALAAGGAAGASTAVSVASISAGAAHVATLLAAAVVTAGGAVELQHTLPASSPHHRIARHAAVTRARKAPSPVGPAVSIAPRTSASKVAATLSAAVVSQGRSPVAVIPGGSSSSASSSMGRDAASPSTTTVSTKVVKVRSTGGISTAISGGGVSPSAQSDGAASTPADAGTTSSTPGAGTSSSTSASTATSTTGSTQPVTGSTSTTLPSSTGSTQPTPPAPSAGTSSGTAAGTGSSAGIVGGGPTTPSQ
jgi:RNA polymerase sigma factor (sigma-70 family)